MTNEQRDALLMRLTTQSAEQGAILTRLDRDVPHLFALHTDLDERVRTLEAARSEASGWRSGTRSAWGTVRWVVGTLIALASLLAGAGLSCILR